MKNEISKWLKDLKEIFETILKGELLFNREGVNYEINLKTEEIKPLLLILTRLEEQQIVKKYLDEMMKKE